MPYFPVPKRLLTGMARTQNAISGYAQPGASTDQLPLMDMRIVPRINTISLEGLLTGSRSPVPGAPGPAVLECDLTCVLQTSGVAGSVNVNGYQALDALLQAAGFARTTTASQVRYMPAPLLVLLDGNASCRPASMEFPFGSALIRGYDFVGSLELSGGAQQVSQLRFQGRGIYHQTQDGVQSAYAGRIAPLPGVNIVLRMFRWAVVTRLVSATAGSTTTFTCDQNHGLAANQWVGITGLTGNWAPANGVWQVTAVTSNTFTIALDSTGFGALTGMGSAGGAADTLAILAEYRFATNAEIVDINDMTHTVGLRRIVPTSWRPELECLIAMDRDAAIALKSAWAIVDGYNVQPWGVRIQQGSGAGNIFRLDVPRAQIVAADPEERNGVMYQRMRFRPVTEAGDSECVISIV